MNELDILKLLKEREHQIREIKLSLKLLNCNKMLLMQTVENVILQEMNYYTLQKDREYLIAALIMIRAYIELGEPYFSNEILFNKVLDKLHINNSKIICNNIQQNIDEVSVTKSGIESCLSRWGHPSESGPLKTEVVQDILYRLKNQKTGNIEYHNSRGHVFKLIIGSSGTSGIYNGACDRYYLFTK